MRNFGDSERLEVQKQHRTNTWFYKAIVTELQKITRARTFNQLQTGTLDSVETGRGIRTWINTEYKNKQKKTTDESHTLGWRTQSREHHWLPEDDGLDALLVLPLLSPWRPRSPEQGAPWFWEAGCPSLVALDTLGRSAAHLSKLYTGSMSFAENKPAVFWVTVSWV